jgi:ATP-dependent DNA helicase RecG
MGIPGGKLWIRGVTSSKSTGMVQIMHPERVPPWPLAPGCSRIVPEYTLPKGVTCARFSGWIRHILDHWPQPAWSPVFFAPSKVIDGQDRVKPEGTSGVSPILDEKIAAFYAAPMAWKTCFSQAHFPKSQDMMGENAPWRMYLAHSQWVAKHVASAQGQKKNKETLPLTVCAPEDFRVQEAFLKEFGHELTKSQSLAWGAISQELKIGIPMMRLLNGDVGSGKTLVAFLAMIQVALSGKQACLMAPTETLVRQHFASLTGWLKDIPVQMILGKGARIGPDKAPIILGTHALFYDGVQFDNMALVVIDEQQRFGVQQRLDLMNKGNHPHVLFLTATPIPRTFQRLISGQMDVSIIEKRPSAIGLTSYVMSTEKIGDLRPWIERCMGQNECVYWVCPVIEDENLGVHARYAYWDAFFPGKVGYLHGGMSAQEKDDAMNQFRNGVRPLLVTTTVIEVGVHVSQASTMFIEESPRFGLSQLHQLRGRVGRDAIAGHCIFLYTPPLSLGARKRLQFMRTCQDGFTIAEQDWLWRGSGTLWGTQQSGHDVCRFIDHQNHGFLGLPSAQDAVFMLAHHPEQCPPLLSLFGYRGEDVLAAG